MTYTSDSAIKKLTGMVTKKIKIGEKDNEKVPHKVKVSAVKKILLSKKNTFKGVLKTVAAKVKGNVDYSPFGFSFVKKVKEHDCYIQLKIHDDRIALTCLYSATKMNKNIEKILHDRYYVLLPTFAALLLSKLKISIVPKVTTTSGYIANVFPISGRFKTWSFKLKG